MGSSLDRDLINLLLLGGGILIAAGGALFGLVFAYRNRPSARRAGGQEPQTSPPSDLPPGLAGALHNRADVHDVIATLLDLGRRGHLTVEETKPERKGHGVAGREYIYTLINDQAPQPFERAVLDALFAGNRAIRLSEVRRRFSTHLWPLYQAMDEELARRGFVRTNSTLAALDRRNGRLVLGLWGLALGILAAGLLLGLLDTPGVWVAAGGGALAGLVGLWASAVLRRMTPRGAAEAGRWFAFKEYLVNLPPEDLREVGRRFDEYLPYAVALTADSLLIEQFRRGRVPVRVPAWYAPLARPPENAGATPAQRSRRKKRRGESDSDAADDGDFAIAPGSGPGDKADDGGGGLPGSVEEWNRGLVGSVESFNRSLAGMITTASIAFTEVAAANNGTSDSSDSGGSGGSEIWSSGSFAGSGDSVPVISSEIWSGGGDSGGGGGGEGSADVH